MHIVSVTKKMWSFSVHKNFLVVWGHGFHNDWILEPIVFEFARIETFHTGEAAKAFLCNVIAEQDLSKRVYVVITDSAPDTIEEVSLLYKDLHKNHPLLYLVFQFSRLLLCTSLEFCCA